MADVRSQSFDESLDRYVRSLLLHALRASGGSRAGAARVLGLSRRRFYRVARRVGVDLARTALAGSRRVERG